jgi:hypothetical protein
MKTALEWVRTLTEQQSNPLKLEPFWVPLKLSNMT